MRGRRIRKKSESPSIQSRLEIGEPHDRYEQEADQVADQVVNGEVQMKPASEEEEKPIQMQPGEEEEKMSMKPEDDEEVRMQPSKTETEEEEKVMRQPDEEESKVMTKPEEEESEKVSMKEEEEEKVSLQEEEEEIKKKPAIQRSGEGKAYASEGIAKNIYRTKGQGQPLPENVQMEMEQKMGGDFSEVKVHTNPEATRMNEGLGAKAFTHGQDIYFNQGNFDPGSSQGKHLLAHELTHVAQQNGGQLIQKQDGGDELQQRLDRIERQYRAMIADARSQGYNVAADNLQRFLDGTGGVQTISSTWLRGFSEVTGAERTNQSRFESSLEDVANQLKDGETRTFTDHWDRQLTGGVTTELYYASGTSTITSRGTFTLTRSGNVITITGTVTHHWWDPYDWHAGLGAFIPGHGSISDADALLLQQHRGAASFNMESDWQQTVTGRVEIIDFWPDSVSFTWSGP